MTGPVMVVRLLMQDHEVTIPSHQRPVTDGRATHTIAAGENSFKCPGGSELRCGLCIGPGNIGTGSETMKKERRSVENNERE
jgi:hypothetical protein